MAASLFRQLCTATAAHVSRPHDNSAVSSTSVAAKVMDPANTATVNLRFQPPISALLVPLCPIGQLLPANGGLKPSTLNPMASVSPGQTSGASALEFDFKLEALPRGSKYPIFKDSGPKYQLVYGF